MSNLLHIAVGEMVATRIRRTTMTSNRPQAGHHILRVVRKTATQAIAVPRFNDNGREVRFRLADGHIIGTSFDKVERATPQLIRKCDQVQAEQARWDAAYQSLTGLFGRHCHELKLTIEQMEHLAKAWQEVLAMAKPEPTLMPKEGGAA